MCLVIDAALFHLVEHGDGIDVLREVEHGVDRLIDVAVLLEVEIVRQQQPDDVRHAPLVNEHRAEDRLLRLERLRHLFCQQFIHVLTPKSANHRIIKKKAVHL